MLAVYFSGHKVPSIVNKKYRDEGVHVNLLANYTEKYVHKINAVMMYLLYTHRVSMTHHHTQLTPRYFQHTHLHIDI